MNAKVNAGPDSSKKTKRLNKSDIQPRRMDFEFDPAIPRYWFDHSQFKTVLLTALSCTFPEGERFFLRSVRHYQPMLRSETLKEEVKGFIGQEAHHGNEHERFNALMQTKGMPTEKVSNFVLEGLKWQAKHLSRERQLAKTCALEHFTAMLAESFLENPELLKGMDERMLPLWLRKGFNWMLGSKGLLRSLGPAYLSYYKRSFHPSQRDSRALRDGGLKKLAAMLKRPELLEALS